MNDIDQIQDELEDIRMRLSELESPKPTQQEIDTSELEKDVLLWRNKADSYLILLKKYGHKFE